MAVSTRVQPIDRDLMLQVNAEASPKERSRQLAEFAQESITEASNTNRQVLGRVPRKRTFVDGREGAPLSAVRPEGVIVAEFELVDDVLKWIAEQLERHSPVGKTGRYKRSHTLFADGVEVAVGGNIPNALEYVFINTVPYARKIEAGSSSQAPDGVYQVVAVLASRRFGNIARINFVFRTAISGVFVGGRAGNRSSQRNPAVLVRVRT